MSTYQKCPVCDGTGLVSRPPHIAGDQRSWSSTSAAPHPCKRCEGIGTIATPASAPVVVPRNQDQGASSASDDHRRIPDDADYLCTGYALVTPNNGILVERGPSGALCIYGSKFEVDAAFVKGTKVVRVDVLRSEATPKEVAVGSSGVGTTLEPSDAAIRTAKEMLANYGTPTATQIVRRILIAAYKADARRAASPSDADTERRNGGCPECGRAAAEFHRARCSRRTHDQEVDVPRAGEAVVAFWDSLDAVTESDERPTESFKVEMDRRIDALRIALECRTRSGIVHREEGTRLGGSNG